MSMKRSEMIEQIKKGLGNRSGITDATVLVWLNWALTDTASLYNWKDMKQYDLSIKTVAGKDWYAMPQNIKDVLSVVYKDGSSSRTVHYVPPEEYRKNYMSPENDGNAKPYHYTIDGNIFRMYPLASEGNKPIEMFVVKWPDEFKASEDAECPLERLDQALIARSISIGARITGEWDKMNVHGNVWRKQVKRIAETQLYPEDYTPQYASQRIVRHREWEFIKQTVRAGETAI